MVMRRCCMATRIPGLLLGLRVLNNDFLPFYAILRAIPSKLGGVSAMLGALVILLPLSTILVGLRNQFYLGYWTYRLAQWILRAFLFPLLGVNQLNIGNIDLGS